MLNLDESRRLYEEACALTPGGSQTAGKRPENLAFGHVPMFLERGEGCHVWDADGNRFIDYIGALGPVSLGYCYPPVDAAIAAQLRKGIIFSMMHPLEIEAARAMQALIPCAEMVRFFKTGAEATSAAVRLARARTGREVVLTNGYHGWHDLWTAERAVPDDRGVPAAYKDHIAAFEFGAVEGAASLAARLHEFDGRAAAIVIEPVSYFAEDTGAYLTHVRDLANRHGVPLVFDEIVCGFRVARGGAQEKYGVVPDLACFAKGMANGMPVAALAGRRDFMEPLRDLFVSSTYGGETLSLAAVAAVCEVYRTEDVTGHMARLGRMLVAGFQEAIAASGLPMIAGGHPAMSGYLFQTPDPKRNHTLTTHFLKETAARGVLLRRNGLNFISYAHTEADIAATLDAIRAALTALAAALNSGTLEELPAAHDRTGPARRI